MNKGVTFDADLLTRREVKRLFLEWEDDPKWLALFTLMYRCGLRVSEVVGDRDDETKGLRIKDIDCDEGVLRVRHGKGDKFRVVAMDPKACEIVCAWVTHMKQDGFADDSFLFVTRTGKPVMATHVRTKLNSSAKNANIKKRVHPHGLRDMFACELLDEGVDLHSIKTLMGHVSLSTTQRYLDKRNPKKALDAVKGRKW